MTDRPKVTCTLGSRGRGKMKKMTKMGRLTDGQTGNL